MCNVRKHCTLFSHCWRRDLLSQLQPSESVARSIVILFVWIVLLKVPEDWVATAIAVCAPLQLMLTESIEKPRPGTVCTWEQVRVSIMSKLPAQLRYTILYRTYRVTMCDVIIHRNQCKIFMKIHSHMASKTRIQMCAILVLLYSSSRISRIYFGISLKRGQMHSSKFSRGGKYKSKEGRRDNPI